MKRSIGIFTLAVLGIALLGCAKESAQTEQAATGTEANTAPAPPTGEGHADATVVAGSYEDWCAEHGVPESACTRCDPSLIPAFKAVQDWDDEHGLPMSQCFKHNPNLKITRPPKPEGQ